MNPLDSIVKLTQGAKAIKDAFVRSSRDRNDEYDLALSALFAATCATKLYVARKTHDPSTEALLAKLWHTAAVAIRRYDGPLADKFYLKGTYWTQPSSWTEQDIETNKIGLTVIHEICRQLILEKK